MQKVNRNLHFNIQHSAGISVLDSAGDEKTSRGRVPRQKPLFSGRNVNVPLNFAKTHPDDPERKLLAHAVGFITKYLLSMVEKNGEFILRFIFIFKHRISNITVCPLLSVFSSFHSSLCVSRVCVSSLLHLM